MEASSDYTVSMIELGDGLQMVLGYLEHPDRLSLAATCKTMVEAVEVYSRAALQQFMKDHVVDEFFQGRTKERFADKTGEPPSRCLLHAAHSTYLCTLEMFPGDGRISGEVAFSKDGTRLVVAGTLPRFQRDPSEPPPLKIYVWDLPTKKLLRTLEVPTIDHESQVFKVYYSLESSIAVCTDQRVLVVDTKEGAELHSCRHAFISSVTQKDSTTLVFAAQHRHIYSFNMITGEKKSIASLPTTPNRWNFCEVLAVFYDRWLIGTCKNDMVSLDLQNGLAIAATHGGVLSATMVSFDVRPGTIHLCHHGKMEALEVNASTGKFQIVHQFPIDVPTFSCRGMVGPHAFFQMNLGKSNAEAKGLFDSPLAEAFLIARTKMNGCVRRLWFPPNSCCGGVPFQVQSNGKEIFVSVKPRYLLETPSKHGVELAVYSANFGF